MPTYEYGCKACGNEWELEQRISENPVRKCPKCGKRKAERLISGGNFILKGDGWYADLYSKPPKPKKSAAEASSTSSESKSSDSDSSSSESKSSDKSDAKPKKKAKKKAKKSA